MALDGAAAGCRRGFMLVKSSHELSSVMNYAITHRFHGQKAKSTVMFFAIATPPGRGQAAGGGSKLARGWNQYDLHLTSHALVFA